MNDIELGRYVTGNMLKLLAGGGSVLIKDHNDGTEARIRIVRGMTKWKLERLDTDGKTWLKTGVMVDDNEH